MYQLKRVETKADWDQFIDLPWSIYKGDPHWVPPLRIAVRDQLDVNKHPFFKHAYLHALIATDKSGKCVGRIIGVIDDTHNRFHKEATAFFGFLESINDQVLANQLLDAVSKWAVSRGMNRLRGPLNPGTNYECGLLIEGFQDSPQVMMTYNPPYYADLFEGWGLEKAKDLYAYNIDSKNKFQDRLMAHAERVKANAEVTFRPVNMKDFSGEVEKILEIYNDAWEHNWGFVPMDPEEFRHMAKDMKAILDPELLLIGEVRGKPAAFGLALPDVNQAIKKVKDGRLFPTGLIKLLWNLKGPVRRKTINRCRVLTLGIKKEYRTLGLGPLLYTEYLKRGPANGYPIGEASWILEDNIPMNKALEGMCGARTKAYRIYDRALSS